MLVITESNFAALETVAVDAFLKRTAQHLRQWFPHHCQPLPDQQLHAAIRTGWQKAKTHGLTAECCVRSYLELMCLLGSDFDTDALLPWANETLHDQAVTDQIARGDLLHKRAWEHAAKVRDNHAKLLASANSYPLIPFGSEPLAPHTMPRLLQFLKQGCRQVFAAKSAHLSKEALLATVAGHVRAAQTYGLTTERSVALFTSARFLLGSGFDHDPLLPWASATLRDSKVGDPNQRAENLHSLSLSFISKWWDLPLEKNRI